MMMIRYMCPACGCAIKTIPEAAGRFIACPDCATESTVPVPRPVPMNSTPAARPPVVRESPDDDDDPIADRRAERVAKSRARTQWLLLFGGFMVTVAVVTITVLWVQNKQQRQALETAKVEQAKPEPQAKSEPRKTTPMRSVPTKTSKGNSAPQPGRANPPTIPDENEDVLPRRPLNVETDTVPSRKVSPIFGNLIPPVVLPDAPHPVGRGRPVVPAPKPANHAPAGVQPPMADPVPDADKAELAKISKNLKSKDAKIRLKAIEEAGKLGEGAKTLATELCDAILDTNGPCATAALVALETVRPDLYKPLAKIALDANEYVKIAGIKELAALGEEAKPALRILHHGLRRNLDEVLDPSFLLIVGNICLALRAMKADDSDTITLVKTVAAPGGIATILGSVGKKPNRSVNYHRHAALDYLVSWADEDEARRKTLIPLVKGGFDNEATILSCLALAGRYGKLSKDLLPTLKQLKLSNTTAVRDAATKAVEAIEADLVKKE